MECKRVKQAYLGSNRSMNLPLNSVFPNLAFKTCYGLQGPRYASFAFFGTFGLAFRATTASPCVRARLPGANRLTLPEDQEHYELRINLRGFLHE